MNDDPLKQTPWGELDRDNWLNKRKDTIMNATIEGFAAEYTPYNTMHAFRIGVVDYLNGRGLDPVHYRGVDAQAYHRGVECAMRVKLANARAEGTRC